MKVGTQRVVFGMSGLLLLLALSVLILSKSHNQSTGQDHSPMTGVGTILNPARDDTLLITFGDRYEPFAWGAGSAVQGVQVDFVREILVKRMGLKVTCLGYPWKRGQGLVKEGKMDGFFTVPTAARAEYTAKSSTPFYENSFVMHVSSDNPIASELASVRTLKDMEDLDHIVHIHMLGSGWHENALRNMEQVVVVPDASVIPEMLVLGRADVYIEQAAMFRYQARNAGVSDKLLTLENPAIQRVGWHLFMGDRSHHRGLMDEINRVLESLRASGELEQIKLEIFEKYGI